jgi:hypothetical protein
VLHRTGVVKDRGRRSGVGGLDVTSARHLSGTGTLSGAAEVAVCGLGGAKLFVQAAVCLGGAGGGGGGAVKGLSSPVTAPNHAAQPTAQLVDIADEGADSAAIADPDPTRAPDGIEVVGEATGVGTQRPDMLTSFRDAAGVDTDLNVAAGVLTGSRECVQLPHRAGTTGSGDADAGGLPTEGVDAVGSCPERGDSGGAVGVDDKVQRLHDCTPLLTGSRLRLKLRGVPRHSEPVDTDFLRIGVGTAGMHRQEADVEVPTLRSDWSSDFLPGQPLFPLAGADRRQKVISGRESEREG